MILKFRWTTSRAKSSFGELITSLYLDDRPFDQVKGLPRDVAKNELLARFLAEKFRKVLTDRPAAYTPTDPGVYGLQFSKPDSGLLTHYEPGATVKVNDGVGWTALLQVAASAGVTIKVLHRDKELELYGVVPIEG